MLAKHVVASVALAVSVALVGVAGASAHETLVKGTVVAVEKARVQVKAVDDDGKPTDKVAWFAVTDKTKVLRAGKVVPFADAKVVPDESVTIVVATGDEAGIEWTCSMHPDVALDKPGKCPLCSMTLKQRERPAKASEVRLSAK